MLKFTASIQKFGEKGEKTGWTYVEIPADLAQELKPGNKKEFKVKGKLDNHPVQQVSLYPMGGGRFILVLNASLRRAIGKQKGAMLTLQLIADNSPYIFNKDFVTCLKDEPAAQQFFESLSGSHQRYFSKWIDSAKTELTRVKRIAMAVNALARKWGYQEMIRANKQKQ